MAYRTYGRDFFSGREASPTWSSGLSWKWSLRLLNSKTLFLATRPTASDPSDSPSSNCFTLLVSGKSEARTKSKQTHKEIWPKMSLIKKLKFPFATFACLALCQRIQDSSQTSSLAIIDSTVTSWQCSRRSILSLSQAVTCVISLTLPCKPFRCQQAS